MKKKWLSLLMVPALTFGLAACGSDEASSDKGKADKGSSEASVGESVDYKIIGIDPGAGLMKATANVLDEYELDDWTLVEGSGAAMTAALKKAYNKEEPIIVTGWSPHWKFSKFDLKYLEDPKGTYGDEENIHSIARIGLAKDHPSAYKVLDQFNWPEEDMNAVMVQITDGEDPEKAARKWVDENTEKVAKWTEGAEEVDGDKITLGYVAWDTEIASTNVVAQVLTDLGYKVTLRQVEAGPMWAGVAEGSLDAHIAGWLPLTHADYYKEFEGKFEDLGANLEGTKIGLVVPAYMDIDSIEDLKE
ncbi:glycine betaine ABC transporter substrate-binding protein [Cytobacillus praedii]|uniref:Glycine/betaine ABC transporter n=1 Tax=Cytobacillus praedii TaxID=1742358 RepID=A0A4R1B0N4_9BACI|nr:glycine betaine ABC transporter substrate-binding protein [Cytobacillus praedii]MED3553806.1 glycine betaine ABC transporter substrate-binding protein [Cytobacillus praedii]TCJ03274.1 glycine/betaine ABC transporter [Cytobacillus praedii]